ncbi:MAG: DUF72 domain-containing protein [Thaumarchaeota archaeon]|nr:DUF72 domain-containing protein [Nitrososphaerota archaeon]
MTRKVHVGVSGFSYARWKGTFYPRETKNEEFLSYYSERLNSVEVNSSFYAMPKSAVLKSWSEKTGEKFVFSFKAPGQITHVLKLGEGSFEVADRLSKTLAVLGPRRGPVLFQTPPYLKEDQKLLDEFLSKTFDVENRVFEFRHISWLNDSTYRLLEKHGAAFCVAETEEMTPVFRVTGGLAYFRLRKDSYDAKDIDRWAEKIGEIAKGSRASYVYLRHDETGENAILAQRLSERLQV